MRLSKRLEATPFSQRTLQRQFSLRHCSTRTGARSENVQTHRTAGTKKLKYLKESLAPSPRAELFHC